MQAQNSPKLRYEVDPDTGCWIWQGSISVGGYGTVSVNGRNEHAHRVSYRRFKGDTPEGYVVHHRCGNKLCINAEHLELLTNVDHSGLHIVELERCDVCAGFLNADGTCKLCHGEGRLAATHCPQGHPYNEANTRWYPSRRGRACRLCQNEIAKRNYHLRKARNAKG